jgi:anti-sigma regulatory factor (Ser/Thr protein kinase)
MQPPAPSALAPRQLDVTYPGRADQIRLVRADLRTVLDDCRLADDVILCASELAANAVLHSRSRLPGGTFTVKVTVSDEGRIRIAVEDNGGLWVGGTPSLEVGHHGLDIIRALASDWGIDGDDAHRTVWAVLNQRP